MQKATVLLLVVGGILGLGIALSFYANQVLFEGLARGEAEVSMGSDLVVQTELSRPDSQKGGVYAVQAADYGGEELAAQVLDPYGSLIESEAIDSDLFEGKFDIGTDGAYKLVVKSSGPDPVKVFGVIGPEPDAGAKSLGFVSLYMLVVGLLGMAGVGIFALKKKRY